MSSTAALSGGSNRATALSLNACPYRADSFSHHRPLFIDSIRATTILTRGAGEPPFAAYSDLPERATQRNVYKEASVSAYDLASEKIGRLHGKNYFNRRPWF